MKLLGMMFQHPMSINHITVAENLTIHNTENEYGIISQYALKQVEQEMQFTLSRKDYQTLSMFDEFDLTLKNHKIIVKTKNGRIVLADMVDVKIPDTTLGEDAIKLNVVARDFAPGHRFVGNDSSRVQLNGVNITPNGYLISNAKCLYMRSADTGAVSPICVPKEAFKYIGDSAMCMTDGKRAAFVNPDGQIFYISLMVVADRMPNLDTKQVCAITANKKQLVETLKMVRGYSPEVELLFNGCLHLISKSESDEFDIKVESKMAKGTKLHVKLYIDDMMKIIDLEKEDQILLSFNNKMLIYNKDETTAVCAYINQPDREVE